MTDIITINGQRYRRLDNDLWPELSDIEASKKRVEALKLADKVKVHVFGVNEGYSVTFVLPNHADISGWKQLERQSSENSSSQ